MANQNNQMGLLSNSPNNPYTRRFGPDGARTHFSEYPINPLTGEPEYLTGDIWSQGIPTSGKGNEIDYYGNETTPNYSGIPMEHPANRSTELVDYDRQFKELLGGYSLPFPQSKEQMASSLYRVGNRDDPTLKLLDETPPRFSAANQMGIAKGYNHQANNAPMSFGSPGLEGSLLSQGPYYPQHQQKQFVDDMPPQISRTMGAGARPRGLLTQPPDANGSNSAQSGYDKNAGWVAAGKIMSDFGQEYMREDPFGDRGR